MNILRLLILICINFTIIAQNKVFVVEIKGPIDFQMTRHVKSALSESEEVGAKIVLIDMNTYGGMVEEADKIKTLLLQHQKPVWVFINDNAASAGALLSLACDSIYMAPGASIGAATVVSGEDGTAMPDKYQSYMRSKMRAAAEANHRDTSIAEAMVDPLVKLDSSIKKEGQVLTLTTKEAIRLGFCERQVSSISEILAHNMIEGYSIVQFQPRFSDTIFNLLMNNFITALIIFAILIGIFIELGAPSGIPSVVVIILGILFFFPRYTAGMIQTWEVVLLGAGLLLLLLEVFVIPGFGIVGIAGIISLLCSIGMMMVNNDYFNFDLVPSETINTIALILFISVLIMAGMLFFLSSRLLDNKFFKRIVLTETLHTEGQTLQTSIKKKELAELIDTVGVTHTALRPSGKIEIEGDIFDALTKGDFIDKGTKIKIVSIFNNTFIVKEHA